MISSILLVVLAQTVTPVRQAQSRDGGVDWSMMSKIWDGVDQANVSATGKLETACDVGTFPDNEPINVAQINGVIPLMGNGITGTGSPRVTIASDNTAFSVNANAGTNLNTSALNLEATQSAMSAKLPATLGQKAMAASMAVVIASDQSAVPVSGTVTVGVFPDNEPINVAQINGVAPLMGTGATGTGSARMTLATNSPSFSTANGAIAADSALSASRAVAYGSSPAAVTAGNHAPAISDLEGIPYANNGHPRAVFCQMAAGTGTTLAVLTGCAAVASNSYYITGIVMTGGIATAATVPALIRSGTGGNCGTATATWATCWHGTAGDCTFSFSPPIKVTVAHEICHIDATAGTKSVMLTGYIAP